MKPGLTAKGIFICRQRGLARPVWSRLPAPLQLPASRPFKHPSCCALWPPVCAADQFRNRPCRTACNSGKAILMRWAASCVCKPGRTRRPGNGLPRVPHWLNFYACRKLRRLLPTGCRVTPKPRPIRSIRMTGSARTLTGCCRPGGIADDCCAPAHTGDSAHVRRLVACRAVLRGCSARARPYGARV